MNYFDDDSLNGTKESAVISRMGDVYKSIEKGQSDWKKSGGSFCPDGCGNCCVDFEPDVTEGEAIYLAWWLLRNKPETAQAIANGTYISPRGENPSGCILFEPDSPFHCTVYDGRCLICRIFGFSGDTGKDGKKRWKPCKFIPEDLLKAKKLEHRQYFEEELMELFGILPPSMAELVQQALSVCPGGESETEPLRHVLPLTIRKLMFIIALNGGDNDDDNPNDTPTPNAA